jgi:hypothetical protein
MKFRTEYHRNNDSTDGNPNLSHRTVFKEHNGFDHANSDPTDGNSDQRLERREYSH